MLDKIRALFAQEDGAPTQDERLLHLAAAALLIEVAKVDHGIDRIELERLREVLARDWEIEEDDIADLVGVAVDASDASVSLHEHIDLINRHFSPQQKVDLVRGLWQVACADDEIHHYEEALIRRLADLIYVSHTDFIRSKHQALGTD